MALTTTDLAALDAAIASAELEVQIEGRRVKYRSTAELLTARKHVAEVLQSTTRPQRAGFRYNFTTQREG